MVCAVVQELVVGPVESASPCWVFKMMWRNVDESALSCCPFGEE